MRSSISHARSRTCQATRRTKYRGSQRLPPRGPEVGRRPGRWSRARPGSPRAPIEPFRRRAGLDLPSEHPQVAPVGVHDVVDDLPQIAPAAARPLGEHLASSGVDGAIERSPARVQDRTQARELGVGDASLIRRRRDRGGTEVGGGVALQTFGHDERGRTGRRLEAEPRSTERLGVPGPVIEEGLERRVRVAPRPTPARPLDRAGERALGTGLHVRPDLRRRHRSEGTDGHQRAEGSATSRRGVWTPSARAGSAAWQRRRGEPVHRLPEEAPASQPPRTAPRRRHERSEEADGVAAGPQRRRPTTMPTTM